MVRLLLASIVVTLSISTISLGQSALEVADKQLNTNYQRVMEKMPESMRDSLRDSQRLWIRYRDANCEFKASLDEKLLLLCLQEETLKKSTELSRLLGLIKDGAIAKLSPDFTNEIKDLLINLDSIPTKSGEGIYWPGGSAHSIITQMLKKISINYVVNQYGKPLFLDGPHTTTAMNFESDSEFGYYDPAFLTWLSEHLNALLSDKAFVKSTELVVDSYLLGTAELFLSTYYYLINNPEIRDEILLDYIEQYQNESLSGNHHRSFYMASFRKENPNWNGETQSERYIWYYPEATTQFDWIFTKLNEDWEYVPIGTAVLFWVRRSIDGTDQQFLDLLKQFYDGYDSKGLTRIENQNFKAPQHLPLGKVEFK